MGPEIDQNSQCYHCGRDEGQGFNNSGPNQQMGEDVDGVHINQKTERKNNCGKNKLSHEIHVHQVAAMIAYPAAKTDIILSKLYGENHALGGEGRYLSEAPIRDWIKLYQ